MKELLGLAVTYYILRAAVVFFVWFLVVQVVCGFLGIAFAMEYVVGVWAASLLIKMAK